MGSSPPGSPSRVAGATKAGRALARTLIGRRHSLAIRLAAHLDDWLKYAGMFDPARDDFDESIAREMHAPIDYLARYFRNRDETYKHLYIGEKLKQLYDPSFAEGAHQVLKRRVTEGDAKALLEPLHGVVSPAEYELLAETLDEIHAIVLGNAPRTVEILLVGDCLYLDVMGMLAATCLEDGVSLRPTFLASKHQAEQHAQIKELSGRRFDLIFYSPLTYEFDIEFASLHSWRKARVGGDELERIVNSATKRIRSNLELLAGLFECPIMVHNSANIRRHDGSLVDRLKNLLTLPCRRAAARLACVRIDEAVAAINARGHEHLFVLDETPLLTRHGEDKLGRMIYKSTLQHPAVMSVHVASAYRDIILTYTHLYGRKLVVCDLDNTIWEGEIGEGQVRHYHDRQETLKSLRQRGLVLAINSRNDAEKVRWTGASLSQDDFVCSQINWDNKAANMSRIQETLNLKTKDFVFIDDRDDQRAMVTAVYPEIYSLDATSDRSWRLFSIWATLLTDTPETDRTLQYRERERRESFLAHQTEETIDPETLFAELAIKVQIRQAKASDIKRVAELINRTNQFNLAGSRTSFRELSQIHEQPDRLVIVVDGADKFGQMGTICAVVVAIGESNVQIPMFVLSCRAFGYGIEKATLNAIKRLVAPREGSMRRPIVGMFRETAHNQPCRTMYSDNGFRWDGSAWVDDASHEMVDPTWLTVVDSLTPVPASRP